MKTLIINLEKEALKKAFIEKQCQDLCLDYEFINAINGYTLSESYIKSISTQYPDNYLTKGEIGCSLSHINVYKKIVAENLPYALVLEDDSVLSDKIPEFLKIFEKKNIKKGIFLLTADFHYLINKKINFDGFDVVEVTKAVRANGYIITNDAAKKLLKFLFPIRYEADIFQVFRLYAGTKIYATLPHLIETNDKSKLNSSIEADRSLSVKQRTEFRKKTIKREINKRLITYFIWKVFFKKFEKSKYYTD
ncbi:glycosyltransferase family 25 protein [Gilliamella apicola]|uniref:glycosyltransferase family 25 protein n=1 Tax=Gilliamella apicola TaxID=1196095 RepID=UPI002FEDEBB4